MTVEARTVVDVLDQAALDVLPVAVFICDAPAGTIVRWNRCAIELCGRELRHHESFSGLLRDVTVSHERMSTPTSSDPIAAAIRDGRPLRNIEAVLGPVGRPGAIRVSVCSNPVHDANGQTTGAIAVCHAVGRMETDGAPQLDERRLTLALEAGKLGWWELDLETRQLRSSPQCRANHGVSPDTDVTERRHMEHALRDSEERFHTLADNIAQLAWMADETGWIFWYNRRWLEYTGKTLEEMQGWGWQQVHHPDHVEAVVQKIRHCFESGEAWEDTFPLRAKDGTYGWFLSRALPIRDAQGRITRWFGTNTDVSDQRRAEDALLDCDRRKDEFLALLGHELRTPLAPIIAAARLLQLTGPPNPRLEKIRGTIVRQAEHMTKLIEDLLDVGRITTGMLRLEKRRVALNAILGQAVEASAPLIERRRHTIAVSMADTPVYLDVDAGRIVQVICNLLNNAAKYMEEGRRIELSGAQQSGLAIIRVRDEGVGIAPEMLNRIFDRFVQVGTSTYRSDGGLGVGLSLVKSLIERHGGTVEARSQGIGTGSEFIVCLPVHAEKEVTA